jgi:hypothetical protein
MPAPTLYLARGHAYESLGDFERARAQIMSWDYDWRVTPTLVR